MKEVIKIEGGHRLNGTVRISGSKNSTVALIPACVLANKPVTIFGVPNISDVKSLMVLLNELGVYVEQKDNETLYIDPSNMENIPMISGAVSKLRASYYFMGALLGKFGHVQIKMPGGCYLGPRPIDLHLKGFEALGATVDYENGCYILHADELVGTNIFLDISSVGATINIMMAAVYANGRTTIENAAREPHIVDLANFLNSMGADVRGAGTDIIKIRGVKQMKGATYSIIPDQIEAGTYMAAAAAAGGDITVHDVIPKHLESITAKLEEMGVEITEYDEAIRVVREKPLAKCNIKTMPHPGFPTDMQPQIAAVLCLADGTSIINENVWDNRFRYVEELRRLGAQISVDGKIAVIEGVKELVGAPVKAMDLRAGAAMVVAGLAARGVTEIENIEYIERGYENIVEKLQGLGADIRRVYFPEASVAQAL